MTKLQRIITNAEIDEIELTVPPGHRHLRAIIPLQTGEELVPPEARVANLVRAYVSIKTHPVRAAIRLKGQWLAAAEKKGWVCRLAAAGGIIPRGNGKIDSYMRIFYAPRFFTEMLVKILVRLSLIIGDPACRANGRKG